MHPVLTLLYIQSCSPRSEDLDPAVLFVKSKEPVGYTELVISRPMPECAYKSQVKFWAI